MSDYDDRSSDESDAGSLEDFIVNSDSEVESVDSTDPPLDSLDVHESNIIQSSVITRGVRRSTRANRGCAPERYVDDQYVRLMTEDIGSDRISDSDDEKQCEDSLHKQKSAEERLKARSKSSRTLSEGSSAFDSPSVAHINGFKQTDWSDPGVSALKVRGPTYLRDRVKIRSSPPLFELRSVDILRNVGGGQVQSRRV